MNIIQKNLIDKIEGKYPYYYDNGQLIINADCLSIMELMENKSIDLVITDPPYKLTSGGAKTSQLGGCLSFGKYGNDGCIVACDITWKQIMTLCYDSLKDNAEAYIMSNNRNLEEALRESREVGFKLHNILVWDKGTVTPNRFYMNRLEYCLYLYKGKARKINNMGCSNLFSVKNKKEFGHPTEKPVELMQKWLENSFFDNINVLDPFMGVGATGVACKNLKANFFGIELKEDFYNIAKNRSSICIELDEEYFNKSCERLKTECNQLLLF